MTNAHTVSKVQEIQMYEMQRPHVVILGAGASKAAFPNGDFKGKKIPLMNDLVEITGVKQLLESYNIEYKNKNFEEIYSILTTDSDKQKLCKDIEKKIYDYFVSLEYPYKPSLYDHLLLSLRHTDLVATFNWDPFLMEAYRRNKNRFKLPRIAFLHGNVTVGYCTKDKICGLNGNKCSKCGQVFIPSPLFISSY